MTASTVDRTSKAVTQLVDAIAALADAHVAAAVERLTPKLLTRLADQLPSPAPSTAAPASATPWMTVAEAAVHSGRHAETLYRALGEYVLSNHRSGLRGAQSGPRGRWRIRQGDLEAWMAGDAPKRRKP